jgi:copper chaperone
MAKQLLTVKGMSCPSCVAGIEGNVSKIEGVRQAKVLFDQGKVDVEYDGDAATLNQIKSTIQDQGYEVTT